MDRIEIEAVISKDRAWLLETYAAMPAEELVRGVTASEHDPSAMWSALDHLVHLVGVEADFNRMIRRHLSGDEHPVDILTDDAGKSRTREQVMEVVHKATEAWVLAHRSRSLGEVVALGQSVRADTLALMSELTDRQLAEKLPGAPWADGTIGGVISANAGHGRMHWAWVKEGRARLEA